MLPRRTRRPTRRSLVAPSSLSTPSWHAWAYPGRAAQSTAPTVAPTNQPQAGARSLLTRPTVPPGAPTTAASSLCVNVRMSMGQCGRVCNNRLRSMPSWSLPLSPLPPPTSRRRPPLRAATRTQPALAPQRRPMAHAFKAQRPARRRAGAGRLDDGLWGSMGTARPTSREKGAVVRGARNRLNLKERLREASSVLGDRSLEIAAHRPPSRWN